MIYQYLLGLLSLVPLFTMLLAAMLSTWWGDRQDAPWYAVQRMSLWGMVASGGALGFRIGLAMGGIVPDVYPIPGLMADMTSAWIAFLVQGLVTVILAFSSRYLEGEPQQRRYLGSLALVAGSVQLFVLADQWVILIASWALVGVALQQLLCFYEDRPFARLAAHKKFLADRVADCCLIGAASLATTAVGSGSISKLIEIVDAQGADPCLHWCCILLALGVIIRTAMLPVHGWLIQVMEAPTPVSALLHAGVVNLGGYVLIRFAPLFLVVAGARWMLVVVGLVTAMTAGFAMLTRVSIKVRLAWSTVAQMGFMVMECGLGLYECAVLHMIGHSMYKAQAFLSSGETVRRSRLRDMRGAWQIGTWSGVIAPLLSCSIVLPISQWLGNGTAVVPNWWLAILGCAWAPLLWVPTSANKQVIFSQVIVGSARIGCLTLLFILGHSLPFGTESQPHTTAGYCALGGMIVVYAGCVLLQLPKSSRWLEPLRRQSYAGFYVDEFYTRLVLRMWPIQLPLQKETQHSIKLSLTAPETPSV